MRILEEMLKEEVDIIEHLSGLPIDIAAMAVASNIWRTGQLFRQDMEQNILQKYQLTWASFSTLFIVWIWEPIEMGEIAKSQSVGRSTITSTVGLLEKRGLCQRNHLNGNRRSVAVTLTPEGKALIEKVFPEFNHNEARFVSGLTDEEAATLTHLLRKVINHNTNS